MKHEKRPKIVARTIAWGIIAIALLGFGFSGLWRRVEKTSGTPSPIKTIVTQSTANPEETQPDCASYRVADTMPRKIIVPSISVDACLQQVATDQEGAVAVPSNVHLAGWFVGSVKPGERGVSLIDGHVLGRYGDAVFGSLSNVTPGDEISVEYGNASLVKFRVVSTGLYALDEVAKIMMKPHLGIVRQLNLITCGGSFDAQSQRYDKRILVTAEAKL